MGLVRYRPNRRGVRDLLSSPGVVADLAERAGRVAAAAQAEYTARPPHSGQVEVIVDVGLEPQSGRARAAVIAKHPGALPIEADRRPLGKSMDAARD
jgi:hypothetical protein